jgi:hypothetical protein
LQTDIHILLALAQDWDPLRAGDEIVSKVFDDGRLEYPS